MADAKSNYLERKLLDHALGTASFTMPAGVHCALFTSDPADDASGAELAGGSYARQAITFDLAATDGVTGDTSAANTNKVDFLDLPTATITHIGLYDAATLGNLLYYGPLQASKSVTAGDNLTLNIGQLTIVEK